MYSNKKLLSVRQRETKSLSYDGDKKLAQETREKKISDETGFEPARPEPTDFKSVPLTTPALILYKTAFQSS